VRELSVWLDRALEREASTRSAALLRIGLAVLILTRFGNAMMLSHKLDGIGVSLLTLFWLCACAMLLGFRAQLATALMALTLIASAGYMWRVLGLNAWSPHHHGYLMIAATGCCAFTPNGRSYSVDRYLAVRSSERRGTAPPPERGRVGALYLAALQLSAVYFWGAVDKTSIGWLEGAKLESQLPVLCVRLRSTGFRWLERTHAGERHRNRRVRVRAGDWAMDRCGTPLADPSGDCVPHRHLRDISHHGVLRAVVSVVSDVLRSR
jgi:hypothetical protein